MPDPALTDNPPAPEDGKPRTRPFDFQLHLHNQGHPTIPRFLAKVRDLTDAMGDRFTVAEVGGADAAREMQAFTAGGRHLDSAYGFDFLYAPALTPQVVVEALAAWPDALGTGWPSWAFENHDAPRAVSRWVAPEHRDAFARAKMLLLACLRGNPIIYYGEELGLTQVEVPFEQLQDAEAIANWPLTLSRDGARTPMPWQGDAIGLGFSDATPWLPVGPDHAVLAVDRQEADAGSMLRWTRAVLSLRQAHPALRTGGVTVIHADAAVLAFERHALDQEEGDERLLCVFNLSPEPQHWAPAKTARWPALAESGAVDDWSFGPFAAIVTRVAGEA